LIINIIIIITYIIIRIRGLIITMMLFKKSIFTENNKSSIDNWGLFYGLIILFIDYSLLYIIKICYKQCNYWLFYKCSLRNIKNYFKLLVVLVLYFLSRPVAPYGRQSSRSGGYGGWKIMWRFWMKIEELRPQEEGKSQLLRKEQSSPG